MSAAPQQQGTVKTFMIAIATDRGPKLLAFRISNLLIGRLPDNHLAINHGSVSRRHARLSVTPKGVFIEDMGSQNGTTINGTESPPNTQSPVRPGDILRIGHVPVYYFGFVRPDAPPALEFVENSVLVNPILPQLA